MRKFFGKADLHVHSNYSYDGFSKVETILKRAEERGLDLIAITDHQTIEGAREAQKISSQFKVEVVIGEEISTKEGELLGLFLKENIAPNRKILETIEEIHRQGGLVIVPHPLNLIHNAVFKKTLFKIFNQVDGIELLNGPWLGKIRQKKSQEMNNLIFQLSAVGGSDAHLARQIGKAYTVFPGKTKEDLYQAIKEKLTLPAGNGWDSKDHLLWMINFPRLLYRRPLFPFNVLSRIIKNQIFK